MEGIWARLRGVWEGSVSVKWIAAVTALLLAAALLVARWPPARIGGDEALGINGLIVKVRNELAQAERQMAADGRSALFVLQDMEMEIRFTVQAGGELKVEGAGLAGTLDQSTERAQTLKLRWTTLPEKTGETPRGGVSMPGTERRVLAPQPMASAAPGN